MPDQKEYTEKDYLIALKKGDATAFDRIFNIYGRRLYYFAFGYLKSKTEAEEVVQEVFLKIWKNREQINPELSFKSYIFTISFRHIRDLFLKLSRERAWLSEAVDSTVNFTTETDDRINYQSLLNLVDKIVERLPSRQRQIFLMRKKEGKPIKEIAAGLGLSPKTVENHLTEAMKKIKEGLSRENLSGLLFFFLFVNP